MKPERRRRHARATLYPSHDSATTESESPWPMARLVRQVSMSMQSDGGNADPEHERRWNSILPIVFLAKPLSTTGSVYLYEYCSREIDALMHRVSARERDGGHETTRVREKFSCTHGDGFSDFRWIRRSTARGVRRTHQLSPIAAVVNDVFPQHW